MHWRVTWFVILYKFSSLVYQPLPVTQNFISAVIFNNSHRYIMNRCVARIMFNPDIKASLKLPLYNSHFTSIEETVHAAVGSFASPGRYISQTNVESPVLLGISIQRFQNRSANNELSIMSAKHDGEMMCYHTFLLYLHTSQCK